MCKYNGKTFTQISLPYIDTTSAWYKNIYPTVNPNQANSILQDNNGIFWIGTSGGGAYKYDGTTFENILAENDIVMKTRSAVAVLLRQLNKKPAKTNFKPTTT